MLKDGLLFNEYKNIFIKKLIYIYTLEYNYFAQKNKPIKGDWVHKIQEDLSKNNINMDGVK